MRALTHVQVLRDYSAYADGMLGRWGTKPNGQQAPDVRRLAAPLMGMFHGEPGNKQWKHAVSGTLNRVLKTQSCNDSNAYHVSRRASQQPVEARGE